MLKPLLTELEKIQEHFQNGDEEGAMEVVKTIFGDLKAIKESKVMGGVKDSDWQKSLETVDSFDLSKVPNSQIAQFMKPEFFEDFIGRMIHL